MADRKKMMMKGEKREPLSPLSTARVSARTVRTKTATPAKTPKTDGASGATKNENNGYDRFIPRRTVMDNDVSNYHLHKSDNSQDEDEDEFQQKMKDNLLNSEVNKCQHKILEMKIKPPENREGEVNGKLLYSTSKPTPAKKAGARFIPSSAMKILDAPDVSDDYYLNLLDWGSTGKVAIALYQTIYLWDSVAGGVTDLFSQVTNMSNDTIITSVKWITDGTHIAVGMSNGTVELWDTLKQEKVRAMRGHPQRVGVLAWNGPFLSSGCKDGSIHNHDVRIANHHTSSFNSHVEEVCGMEWAPDGHYFASGANDYALNVWDLRKVNAIASAAQPCVEIDTPVMSLVGHTSAVKAVSWCPWQRHVLASGGGITDRNIKIWSTIRGTGNCINSHDVMFPVSDVLWSETYKEIVASYGNNLGIWKYPSFDRETELLGHSERVLAISMSPDGQEVASVGADETLRLWKCFEPPVKKAKTSSIKDLQGTTQKYTIR